ncbi:MAG: pilus assembly protein [Rhodospirillales bacterium]|jgi:Flp pilus assembly protein TadG|nr:pilus assembly protein [Rhodospirillales bacterium]
MIGRWIRKFIRDRRGTLALETAFAVPVLAALVLSGVEVTRYVLLNQKIERASATMADLVSQAETLSEPDLASLFTATGFVVDPFDLAVDGRLIVSSISTTGTAAAHVNWQRGFGGGGGSSAFGVEGGDAVLPDGLVVRDGESIIVGEAFFDFTPIFTGGVMGDTTVYNSAVLRPRFGSLTSLN